MKRSDYLAMAVAPVAAPVLPGLLLGKETLAVMVLGVPLAYFAALLVGWPLLSFFRHPGWARLWVLSLSGLALSVPFAALSALLGWRPVVGVLLFGAIGGGLVWFLAVGPNNSFKPMPLRGTA